MPLLAGPTDRWTKYLKNIMVLCVRNLHREKSDLYLNQGPRKVRFPPNLAFGRKDGRTLVFVE